MDPAVIAIVVVVVLVLGAFLISGGMLDGPRRTARRTRVVERPAREVVVERERPVERVVEERRVVDEP